MGSFENIGLKEVNCANRSFQPLSIAENEHAQVGHFDHFCDFFILLTIHIVSAVTPPILDITKRGLRHSKEQTKYLQKLSYYLSKLIIFSLSQARVQKKRLFQN